MGGRSVAVSSVWSGPLCQTVADRRYLDLAPLFPLVFAVGAFGVLWLRAGPTDQEGQGTEGPFATASVELVVNFGLERAGSANRSWVSPVHLRLVLLRSTE